jgi:hypothetical protein
VIAADGRQIERHQPLGGFARQQRARDDVAQVHDEVHPAPPDVGEHGVECEEVSMDVGNRGNSHTLIDLLEMPVLLELVFQFPHQGLQ